MAKRDTYNYDLKDGRRVVYRGITNNPAARVEEHLIDGKDFTHMRVHGGPRTRSSAKAREAEMLETYRRGHDGQNPKYNKTDKG